MTCSMVKEEKNCVTILFMKELSKKVKRTVKVVMFGQMARPMRVNGKTMK